MHWKRLGAIGVVLTDEIVFTLFYFVLLPLFDVHLPLTIYIVVMLVLVTKDVIVVKLIWNIVIRQPQIGKEALIGKTGIAYTDMDSYGIVQIDNELWKAETAIPINKGEKVRVLKMDGLFLQVEPASSGKS
jgi:membrane-bound ClpP family serine protease